jgi:hypothetical protein
MSRIEKLLMLMLILVLAAFPHAHGQDLSGRARKLTRPANMSAKAASSSATPRVFLIDRGHLEQVKRSIASGDKTFVPALKRLDADSDRALAEGTFSVVTKRVTPPSGDKHDYMSQAPYFWPDTSKTDGRPYIRRDGERNPEINKISDHRSMDQMVGAVSALALAYYFKGEERYAAKATEILRAWFLDPETRMNPNLQYAQGIPGITTGRGIGLIETRGLTRVVDAIGLLGNSKALTETDRKGIENWFAKFLTWLQESKNGREENAAKNNHGTFYDVQAVSFALFLGKTALAKSILETAKQKRIALQIEPDGRQPLELVRTRAWGYSVGNLDGLMQLAVLAEGVGIDLWNYKTADGRSIRGALEFLYPISLGQKWKYQQLGEWQPQTLFPLMRRAANRYKDEQFKTMIAKIPAADVSDRESLVSR